MSVCTHVCERFSSVSAFPPFAANFSGVYVSTDTTQMVLHNTVFSDHWFVKYYFQDTLSDTFGSIYHIRCHTFALSRVREINQKFQTANSTFFTLRSAKLTSPWPAASYFRLAANRCSSGKPLQCSANKRRISDVRNAKQN